MTVVDKNQESYDIAHNDVPTLIVIVKNETALDRQWNGMYLNDSVYINFQRHLQLPGLVTEE